jgi:uncharacterized protein (TIGR03067 family)
VEKIVHRAALLAVLCVVPLSAAPVPKSVKRVKDEVSIVGCWRLVKYDRGPDKPELSARLLAVLGVAFKMEGEVLLFGRQEADGYDMTWECRLDPTATPKAIDLTGGSGTDLGVYELDGDSLRLCINHGIRPAAVSSDEGPAVMVYQRVKDEKKDK